MKRTVRVGNAGGYWGDDPRALESQVLGPEPPEFVTADFLAEITMSILQKARARDPEAGYARDFVSQIAPLLGAIRERGITVITNAGGVNPGACARAVLRTATQAGIDLTVAVVDGDDLIGRLDALLDDGAGFDNLETGDRFAPRRGDVLSANAYFGAEPIVRALAHRPDVVVTGRVTDTGITLAPIRHALGWDPHDWDRIAGGIVPVTSSSAACRPPEGTSPTGSGFPASATRAFRSSRSRKTAPSCSRSSPEPAAGSPPRSSGNNSSTSWAIRSATCARTRPWTSRVSPWPLPGRIGCASGERGEVRPPVT